MLGAQSVFRAIMDALARPGTVAAHRLDAAPPAPLTPELGAVALTLCDHDTPVWLDPTLRASDAVVAWLALPHRRAADDRSGAGGRSRFVTDADLLPPLDQFALGTQEYPDRSTTIVLAVPASTAAPS